MVSADDSPSSWQDMFASVQDMLGSPSKSVEVPGGG